MNWIRSTTTIKQMILLLLFFLFFTTLVFWNFVWKRKGLPPGPTPLPLFGNAFAINNSIYEKFQKWSKEYGPVYTVWLGEDPTVMVTDYEIMRDLFVKEGEVYAGRNFMSELFKTCTASKGDYGGVIRTEGEPWKVVRRFGLQSMRNLGVGRAGLEKHLIEDMDRFVDQIKEEILKNGGFEVNLQKKIDRLAGSTINRVLFGYPFEDEQMTEFYELKHHMEQQAFLLSSLTGRLLITMPWLHHFPIFSQTFKKIDKNLENIYEFIKNPINKRIEERAKQTIEERGEPKDLIDYFLDQIENEKNEYFSLKSITPFCFDLFLAGQETTSTTLSYLILYLLLDQRVQTKMHKELDNLEEEKKNNNLDNVITQADRGKLPYLNAVINETQRVCNLLPINLTHRTMADSTILGGKFHLKKGTSITPQICCVLLDEKIFPNPQRFEPERFIDEQGQLKRIEEFIPFGLGKRMCMGESLARTELFLFTANFFRNFQVLPVDPLHPPSSEKIKGFSVRLKPYKCRLILRSI
ncbi:hypothetical protein Mgra_00009378 [Meloidogyne graminicola]|uniref:Cytochrome P450 n=1 Tax=Meloidogyne graminicola TaxID=189291 RepID=A0A8S9ZC75_9BILA|nr:hypothetical protein Mgra_00009378 [Meloidogyne graminicola]